MSERDARDTRRLVAAAVTALVILLIGAGIAWSQRAAPGGSGRISSLSMWSRLHG